MKFIETPLKNTGTAKENHIGVMARLSGWLCCAFVCGCAFFYLRLRQLCGLPTMAGNLVWDFCHLEIEHTLVVKFIFKPTKKFVSSY